MLTTCVRLSVQDLTNVCRAGQVDWEGGTETLEPEDSFFENKDLLDQLADRFNVGRGATCC
jgi:hypothetical protein